MNYLAADDFMLLCEAECLHDAKDQYWNEFSKIAFDDYAERLHP